jgi:competence protein ComEA
MMAKWWLWPWLASFWLAAGGPALAAVDANAASREELARVSGIGPSLAQRIVAERRNGAFRDLDDLATRVRGIGQASLQRLVRGGLVVGDGRASRAEPASRQTRPRDSATPIKDGRRNDAVDVHVGLRGDARPR